MKISKNSQNHPMYDYGIYDSYKANNLYNCNIDNEFLNFSSSQDKSDLNHDKLKQIKDIHSFAIINNTNETISIAEYNDYHDDANDDNRPSLTDNNSFKQQQEEKHISILDKEIPNECHMSYNAMPYVSTDFLETQKRNSFCMMNGDQEEHISKGIIAPENEIKAKKIELGKRNKDKDANQPQKFIKKPEQHFHKRLLDSKHLINEKENISYIANQSKISTNQGSTNNSLNQTYYKENPISNNSKNRNNVQLEVKQDMNLLVNSLKHDKANHKHNGIMEVKKDLHSLANSLKPDKANLKHNDINGLLVKKNSYKKKDFREENSNIQAILPNNNNNNITKKAKFIPQAIEKNNNRVFEIKSKQYPNDFANLPRQNENRQNNQYSHRNFEHDSTNYQTRLSARTIYSSLSDHEFDLSRSEKESNSQRNITKINNLIKSNLIEGGIVDEFSEPMNFSTNLEEKVQVSQSEFDNTCINHNEAGYSKITSINTMVDDDNDIDPDDDPHIDIDFFSNDKYSRCNKDNDNNGDDANDDGDSVFSREETHKEKNLFNKNIRLDKYSPKFDYLLSVSVNTDELNRYEKNEKNEDLLNEMKMEQNLPKPQLNFQYPANDHDYNLITERSNNSGNGQTTALKSSRSGSKAAKLRAKSPKHVFVKIEDDNNVVNNFSLRALIHQNLQRKKSSDNVSISKTDIHVKKSKNQSQTDRIQKLNHLETKKQPNKTLKNSASTSRIRPNVPNLGQISGNQSNFAHQVDNLLEFDKTLLKIESNLKLIQHEKMLISEQKNLYRDRSNPLNKNPLNSISSTRPNFTKADQNSSIQGSKSLNKFKDIKTQQTDKLPSQTHILSSLPYNQSTIHGQSIDDYQNVLNSDSSQDYAPHHLHNPHHHHHYHHHHQDLITSKSPIMLHMNQCSSLIDLNSSCIFKKNQVQRLEEAIIPMKLVSNQQIRSQNELNSENPKKYWTDLSLYERNNMWLNAKKAKMHILQHGQEQEELKECTFFPRLETKNSYNGIMRYSARSLGRERMSCLSSSCSSSTRMTAKSNYNKIISCSRSLSSERKNCNSYSKFFDIKKKFYSDVNNNMMMIPQTPIATTTLLNNIHTNANKCEALNKRFCDTIKISDMLRKCKK